eukprot:IDg3464t1
MSEARDDLAVQITAKKTAQQDIESEKERASQALVDMSLKRKSADDGSCEYLKERQKICFERDRAAEDRAERDLDRSRTSRRARESSKAGAREVQALIASLEKK